MRLAVLTLAISVLIAEGAKPRWRGLRRYKLCRRGQYAGDPALSCVAWLIGLPAGLCASWSVLEPTGRAGRVSACKVARPAHSRSIAQGEVLVISRQDVLIDALLVGRSARRCLFVELRSGPAPAALPATVEALSADADAFSPRSQGWVLGPTGPADYDRCIRSTRASSESAANRASRHGPPGHLRGISARGREHRAALRRVGSPSL